MIPRMLEKYKQTVYPELQKKFNFKNVMQVPRMLKIVVNMGVGRSKENRVILDQVMKDLGTITCQTPVIAKARISVAGFKVREGMPIGTMVTLRKNKMYEFFDRLISVVIPRIKDFRGLNGNSFDLSGNYTLGLADQLVFPEIDPDEVQFNQGMSITIVTSSKNAEVSRTFLELMGMPFRKEAIPGEKIVKKAATALKETKEKKK